MPYQRVIEHPDKKEALAYAARLRKQGYNARVVQTRDGWRVESDNLHSNPAQRMLG